MTGRLRIWLWAGLLDLVLKHSIEDAVNESARLRGAVPFGQLESLVDGDLCGHLGPKQHFIGSEAEDVAVDCRHPIESPVFGDLGDHRVNPRLMFFDAVDQPMSKLAEFVVFQEPPLDETANLIGRYRGILLDLVQDLESDFAASGTSRHDQVASPFEIHAAIALAETVARGTRPTFAGQRIGRQFGLRDEEPVLGRIRKVVTHNTSFDGTEAFSVHFVHADHTPRRAKPKRGLNALARSWEGEPPGEPPRNPARTEPRPPGITQGCLEQWAAWIGKLWSRLGTRKTPYAVLMGAFLDKRGSANFGANLRTVELINSG
jgi:hypothetical protein